MEVPLTGLSLSTDPWSVETLTGGVTRITFKLHLWVFVSSDWHWDSTHCDRERLAHDLGLAKKHHAAVLSLGDGFDAMGGKFDPRSTKHSIRPELQTDDYFDSCVTQCAQWLKPYKESLALITPGNHESAVRKRQETCLTMWPDSERLCADGKKKATSGGNAGDPGTVFWAGASPGGGSNRLTSRSAVGQRLWKYH